MIKLFLVLVLYSDPANEAVARALASRLTAVEGATVQVSLGKAATAALEKRGLRDADLLSAPEVGIQLTRQEPGLAVVRLERLVRGTDELVESRIWLAGRREGFVAISGGRSASASLPVEPAVRGISSILGPWLAGGSQGGQPGEAQLGSLADQSDWAGILRVVQAAAQPGPRLRYYQVLALTRLGRGEEARRALLAFKAEAPGHVLLAAAEDIAAQPAPVPSSSATAADPDDINNARTIDAGGNELR